ncbi:SgrR family transcriptional regulator [Vibrio sp. SCSIO 43136]|uniref:SgrR family transcriptional regulator n=1 Tax=Vibrio sp. SCSIO 43136 TaxID=2819101 RepID=UPI0020763643|nr:SgrR family transcriptional regulator [Vibrio sp. SCSIO 43136]USD66769.1 SgrR family transcriptional regulator [Vibrio sp. SCSIO 43136]
MSSPRLRIQFETLFEHYAGEDSDVQLEDITEILFCTRRNARIVLNKLAEEGWIEWHPAAGRGKLSKLLFKRNKQDVSENLAKRYLEEGKIGQALNVLERDPSRLTQVIQDYLGLQHQQGQQVIRLPYYRALANLNPHKPTRRSEKHIIRQVFSGLTRLDENDKVQGDLAHEWEMLSDTHWRFYLRANIRCHNGNLLHNEQVIESLTRSAKSPLFEHITDIEQLSENVLDIKLSQPDYRLPLLLTETNAKIVPYSDEESEHSDLVPIGTGPFRVVSNDDKRLVLEAFDHYFGYRPLLDKVEVWVVDETFSTLVYPSLQHPVKPDSHEHEEVDLDPGCTYLLLNRRSGLATDEEWANYFVAKLNSFALFERLPKDEIGELGLLHAHGLKPGWFHSKPVTGVQTPPSKKTVNIAYHCYHPGFKRQSKAIEEILRADGLEVNYLRYDVDLPSDSNVDIWLKPMGLSSNREDGLAGWLFGYSDIERMSQPEEFTKWRTLVNDWRATSDGAFPGKQLSKSIIESKQIIPMFHCWLGLSKDHCGSLQNAKANALGWFDFHKVWVRP